MKKISVVLIAALVVSLLFGCGKSDDAKGTGKTTLSVWYWGEQEVPGYKAYMEEMVKRYEKKNPDIKVEAVLQESDNLYTAFRTAEAAGEGPDIQYMWGGTQAMEDVWKGNVFLKKNSRLFRSRHWLRRIGTGNNGESRHMDLHMGLPMIKKQCVLPE